jgi:hypothetical protein
MFPVWSLIFLNGHRITNRHTERKRVRPPFTIFFEPQRRHCKESLRGPRYRLYNSGDDLESCASALSRPKRSKELNKYTVKRVLSVYFSCSFCFSLVAYFQIIHFSFIHSSMALQPLLGLGLFFSSVIFFTQSIGLLGGVISPSQGRYLYTEQHRHRINPQTDIHALNGIRTHDPSVRASEDSSCLRSRGHRDRHFQII